MYQPCKVKAVHTRRTVEWHPLEDTNYLLFGDDYFDLVHFHFTVPSEHTINGERKHLELQFTHIHTEDESRQLVLSFLYTLGNKSCPLISQLCHKNLIPFCQQDEPKELSVNLNGSGSKGKGFFYRGSISPCTEGVSHIVHKKIRVITEHQLQLLAGVIPNSKNVRPIQELSVHRKVWEVKINQRSPVDQWHPDNDLSSGTYGFRSVSSSKSQDMMEYIVMCAAMEKKDSQEEESSILMIEPNSQRRTTGFSRGSNKSRCSRYSTTGPGRSTTKYSSILLASYRNSSLCPRTTSCPRTSNISRWSERSRFSAMTVTYYSEELSEPREEEKEEWNYIKGHKNGPEFWEDTFPESCGNYQSPINVCTKKFTATPSGQKRDKITINYQPCRVLSKNNGKYLSWTLQTRGGYVKCNGKKYWLQDFSVHSPAEHLINGERGCLELQLFHKNNDLNKTCAICFVYTEDTKTNNDDSFFADLCRRLPLNNGDVHQLPSSNPQLLPTSGTYCSYQGSLTVPPCSQGVRWYVNCTMQVFSQNQLKLLQAYVPHENARPLQPVNGRALKEILVGDIIE